MKLQFVTPNQHGIGDHGAASLLIVMTFVLGLGASSLLAKWINVGMGVFLVSYSLLTKYRLGVLKVLRFPSHLAIDKIDAMVFVVSPFLFHFSGIDFCYVIVAISVILIVLVTMPKQPADRIWR